MSWQAVQSWPATSYPVTGRQTGQARPAPRRPEEEPVDISLPRLSSDHIRRRRTAITMLLALAAALQLAAGAGLAYVAGFASVRAVLGHFQWAWIPAMAGALGVACGARRKPSPT
jgi:hypothetical protein